MRYGGRHAAAGDRSDAAATRPGGAGRRGHHGSYRGLEPLLRRRQEVRRRMPRLLLLLPTATYRTAAFVEAARRLDVELTVASERPSTFQAAKIGRAHV